MLWLSILGVLEQALRLAPPEDRGKLLAAIVAAGQHNQERLEALIDVAQGGNQA